MAGDWIHVRNWDKWQSYRKDRNPPPWIKLHLQLMTNVDWVSLTDAERGQLTALWLLAGRHGGVIPASPPLLKKLCYLENEPDLQVFIDKGFLEWRQDDVNVTSEWRQAGNHYVAPEAEAEAEAEAEKNCMHACSEDEKSKKPGSETVDMFRGLPPAIWTMKSEWSVMNTFVKWLGEHQPEGVKNLEVLAAVIAARHGDPKADPARYAAKCLDGGVRENWILQARDLVKRSQAKTSR